MSVFGAGATPPPDEWEAYADRARRELLPKLRASSTMLVIAPSSQELDIQMATQLGAMIYLDKPIILLVPPGTKVVERLARVADRIIEAPERWASDPATAQRIQAAIAEAMDELDPGSD